MPIASFIAGIFAVLIAALGTAPCFMWLGALVGLPIAAIGVILGAIGIGQSIRRKYAGEDASEARYALSGIVMCALSAVWIGLMLAVRGPI